MITLKRNKGSALSHDELDDNFEGSLNLFDDQSINGIKTFVVSPVVPTSIATDSSTKVATTAFVKNVSALVLKENITLSVGPGLTYTTLNSALNYLKQYIPNRYKATIILMDNFVMAEQVFVEGIDLSWVTIKSNTPNRIIDIASVNMTESVRLFGGSFDAITMEDKWITYHPVFFINSSTSPNIKCRFDFVNTANIDPSVELYVGIIVHNNSKATILDYVSNDTFSNINGFSSFHINAFVLDNSILNAVYCNFSDKTYLTNPANFTSYVGLFVTDNSSANVEHSNFTCCQTGIFSMSSTVNAKFIVAGNVIVQSIHTSCCNNGVRALSSRIILDNATIKDSVIGNIKLEASDVSIINAENINNFDSYAFDVTILNGSTARMSTLIYNHSFNGGINQVTRNGIIFYPTWG
jgi:hypothetical protein